MEAVIFIGIQASGKSTFYVERFFATHVRISLDQVRTRHRERALLATCLAIGQPLVVDNTNPTAEERAVYRTAAHAAGFRVVGYFFQSRVAESMMRNAGRSGAGRVPDKAISGTSRRLELPSRAEGFDQLFFVRIDPDHRFVVEEWRDAV